MVKAHWSSTNSHRIHYYTKKLTKTRELQSFLTWKMCEQHWHKPTIASTKLLSAEGGKIIVVERHGSKRSCAIKKGANEVCSALFGAPAIPINNVGERSSRLTHITDRERKELCSFLNQYANMFSLQGAELRQTNTIKYTINTGEAIWRPRDPHHRPFRKR